VGEDDAAAVRRCLPVAIPSIDQIAARLLARFGGMHHAVTVIGADRIAGSSCRQITGCVTLPVLALAAHLMDFHATMTVVDRPARRARLDGLQLLRIADQNNLCASLRGMGQNALHLQRADHARLVDDKHVAAGVSMSRPCPQLCSMLAMVREDMPDPLSRFSAAMPDRATPPTSKPAASHASQATPRMALFPVPA
jgi:hypothetical protein